MIPLQTIRGAVICFSVVVEKEQHPMRDTHTVFTAVVSAWRKGMCLASEEIHGCCEEDVDDFWRENSGLKKEGPFFDAMQIVLGKAEEMGMISKERHKGVAPMKLLAEFIYLDAEDFLRWCPRSQALREDAGYDRYERFNGFVNKRFAHARVAQPQFTFMGESYEYEELHAYLTEKQRKNRKKRG